MIHIQVPESELELTYARSSGPGGQNVNKVNSKAVLRWNFLASRAFSDEIRLRLLPKIASRLNAEGELVISSDRFRDQIRNREDCIEKLGRILAEISYEPKPRKKTKPSRSAKLKRVESKKKHSAKKQQRRFSRDD